DDRDFGDIDSADQQVFDFFRRNVLAVANDDVLAAARDDEIIAVDPAREIARAIKTFGIEYRRFVLGVQIPDEHLRAARAHFAALPDSALGIDQFHLGHTRPTIGVGRVRDIIAIEHADRNHGYFGRAVHARDGSALEIIGGFANQRRRYRSSA